MQGLNDIEDEERRIRENAGGNFDMILKTNIEGIIVKWAHQVGIKHQAGLTMFNDPTHPSQVDEVLSLESESLLVDSPGPMVEIKFWEAKCLNLECLHEQVRCLAAEDRMRKRIVLDDG